MVDCILAGVVAWAVGMVSWLVIRNDRNQQRSLDALLVLTDKQAAATVTGMEVARKRPVPTRKETVAENEAKRKKAEHNRILEDIENASVLTPAQEEYLEAHNGRV